MTTVERYSGGISIAGHANYAEAGKDIVCAAVSTLAQTLIASIEELTTDEIHYSISPGKVDIEHGHLSEAAHTLIDAFFVGIRMIADEYPDFVRIV